MNASPAEFIEQRGDAAVVARAIGTDPARVRMWKHRNRIPRDAWPEIMTAFPDVTMPMLLEIEEKAA